MWVVMFDGGNGFAYRTQAEAATFVSMMFNKSGGKFHGTITYDASRAVNDSWVLDNIG